MFRSEQEHGKARQFSTVIAKVPYQRLIMLLAALVVVVVIAGLAADLSLVARPGYWRDQILNVFSLGAETTIPTWISSILLLSCSVLLAVTAKIATASGMKHAASWWLLSGIFCLLSLDEVAMLHERSGLVLKALIPSTQEIGGIFYYTWTLFAIPAVAMLALILLRWFFALSWRLRLQFGAAAFIFLSGAIGVEMFNSALDARGAPKATYIVFTAFEESLEFAGVLVFLYALLDNLHRLGASVAISLAPAD